MISWNRVSAHRRLAVATSLLLLGALAACEEFDPTNPDRGGSLQGDGLGTCTIDESFLASGGVGRNGIPSLTDPAMAPVGDPGLDYLRPGDRVVGFILDGQAYAVPHNILWWHEIVNLNIEGRQLAVTLCPLTGTSLGFDRSSIGGDELGVSGLLFKANLVMFNRGDPEGFWPQMLGEARCAEGLGRTLSRFPVVEMRWDAWRVRHPATLAITDDTGHPRDYDVYPYGNYERLDNADFLNFPMPPLDTRRPPKERVIGVPPTGDGDAGGPARTGIAFPFGTLEDADTDFAVVEFTWEGAPAVVLWSVGAQGAMVYRPRTRDGREVRLVAEPGGIVDVETGTRWGVDGRARSGELAGAALVPVASAYPAFWGAWAAFFPETVLWDG